MTNLQSVLLGVVLLVIALLVRSLCGVVTVYAYEKALRFRSGRLAGVLAPGKYFFLRLFTEIRKVDARLQIVTIPGQEILSVDGVALKMSLAAKYVVTDVERALLGSGDYAASLYLEVQNAARSVISTVSAEDSLAKRAELATRVHELSRPALVKLGLDLQEIAIKDLVLPGEFKKLFAQVVKARQEGLAQLERARGETAALRCLVNAAQLVDKHPAILQLRQLQVFSDSGQHSLVLGGQAVLPVAKQSARGDGGAESERDSAP
ncbi:MAG: slipin family protein [Planctomycetota bacterium]